MPGILSSGGRLTSAKILGDPILKRTARILNGIMMGSGLGAAEEYAAEGATAYLNFSLTSLLKQDQAVVSVTLISGGRQSTLYSSPLIMQKKFLKLQELVQAWVSQWVAVRLS